jgi:hypothetical protein
VELLVVYSLLSQKLLPLRFSLLLDLPKTFLTELHDDMDPLIFNPRVEVSNDVRAIGADGQS